MQNNWISRKIDFKWVKYYHSLEHMTVQRACYCICRPTLNIKEDHCSILHLSVLWQQTWSYYMRMHPNKHVVFMDTLLTWTHQNKEATKLAGVCVCVREGGDAVPRHKSQSRKLFSPLGWPHFALPVHKDSSGLRHYLASTLLVGLEK